MLNLEIRIGSPGNLLAVAVLVAVAVAWMFVWAPRRNAALLSMPFLAVMAACAAIWAAWGYGGLDEPEHLHCAYLVSRGLLPFRDFWQHHSPLIWLFLAWLMRWLDGSPWVFEIVRVIWTGVFVLIGLFGWAIARRTWRQRADGVVYLLVFLGGGVLWQFCVGRPDLLEILFMVAALYFCLHVAEGRWWACLCCGAALSFALTCTYKQIPLVVVPPIVILSRGRGGRTGRLAVYGAGLVLGVLPLAFYLAHNGLLRDYVDWVLRFNRSVAFVSASFPLGVAVAGMVGWWCLLRSRLALQVPRSMVLLVAWPVCALASMPNTGATMYYYLNLWMVLGAVISAGLPAREWLGRLAGRRAVFSAVAGALLAILTLPSLYSARQAVSGPRPFSHAELARLIALCRNDTCLALLPHHPIFCLDATRLYSTWQYEYAKDFDQVRQDLAGLATDVLKRKPALITHDVSTLMGIDKGDELFHDMLKRGLITQADYDRIQAMLSVDYTVEEIGGWRYYVRNDRTGAWAGDRNDKLTGRTPM